MRPLRSWRFWLLNVGVAIVAFCNLFVLSHSAPFFRGNTTFNVNRVIERAHWVEGAPVVLTNHFSTVHVRNIGDRFENGFGFESELVGIFKVRSVDRTKDPIDVRDKITLAELKRHVHYETTTHCSLGTSKYCKLYLIWDHKNSAPYRTFIGVLIEDKSFALIDSNLYRNLIGDPSAE